MDIITQLGLPIIILYACIGYAARIGVNFNIIRIVLDLIEHVLRIFALLQLSTLLMFIIDFATPYTSSVGAPGVPGSGGDPGIPGIQLYEVLLNLTKKHI